MSNRTAQIIHKTLKEFANELTITFPAEGNFILMKVFLDTNTNIDLIINGLKENLLPYKYDFINNKDDDDLLVQKRRDVFFQDLTLKMTSHTDILSHFKNLWKTIHIDNKNMIWLWITAIVELTMKL